MPTLEQIQAKLKKLQAQADVIIARKAQVAVDQIRDLMLKHGLTTADIEAKAKARRAAQGLNGHAASGKTKALSAGGAKVAKYRDAKTGATWTGHGRAPGWIAAVKDRTQFLVDGASEVKSVTKAALKSAKAGKGQPKGAQPPKYRDPKSGATWSGRGPAPAWLASVKDRTKFLIDGAAAAASSVAPKAASKASAKSAKAKVAVKKVAAKKSAASKTAAKKAVVATRKTAAKKAAVKKVATRKTAPKAKAAVTNAAASQSSAAETAA